MKAVYILYIFITYNYQEKKTLKKTQVQAFGEPFNRQNSNFTNIPKFPLNWIIIKNDQFNKFTYT